MNLLKSFAITAITASLPLVASPAGAAPLSQSLALTTASAATTQTETVQWRRGWRGGYWRGGRWIGPAVAGAIIGGALTAGAYGPYGYGYYGGPYAYDPGYAVVPGGGDVAYCQQRFRSYDVRTGTYLGYDGLRHPCP
jgi:hypothetical protein